MFGRFPVGTALLFFGFGMGGMVYQLVLQYVAGNLVNNQTPPDPVFLVSCVIGLFSVIIWAITPEDKTSKRQPTISEVWESGFSAGYEKAMNDVEEDKIATASEAREGSAPQ